MRIAIVKFAYPQYLAWYHRRHPRARRGTYAEQRAALDHDAFWWGDHWTHALTPLGHRVEEFVMNDEPLQRAWAREQGLAVGRLDWMLPILRAQLRELQPNALFIQSFRGLRYESLRRLQEACPSIRRTVGWCGGPPPVDRDEFRACDAMLSCVPESVDELRRRGHRAHHLHHAFDPRVLERLEPPREEAIELSFVGNVTSQDMYVDRVELLRRIEREIPIRVYTFLGGSPVARLAKTAAGRAAYPLARALERAGLDRSVVQALPGLGPAATWSGSPRYPRAPIARRNLRGPVYGLEMLQTLRDSKVTLDVHRRHHSSSNLRLFEAPGVGTCLLTDWRPNLAGLFELDREVAAYRSAEECVEKARWLLDHPAERERIARAGQARVLAEHTFAHRAPELDRVLRGA